MFITVICRDVLEDIVDLSAVDYTKRHTTPSPEVVLVSYIYVETYSSQSLPRGRGEKHQELREVARGGAQRCEVVEF